MIKTCTATVTLLVAVAGALVGVDSFYARKDWAVEQIAGLQLQYSAQREDVLERRIFDLEIEKRRMGSEWPAFMEKELQRLRAERDRIKQDIERYRNK